MYNAKKNKLAVWILTPNGSQLADKIHQNLPDVCVYASPKIAAETTGYLTFQNLSESIKQKFRQHSGHIFIMSTGIVVRVIAPLIKHKTEDPAVVVVDDGGHHAISLLSGHLGGANELARQIAGILGAKPVITTATDVNQLPAIDVLAKEKRLFIENPAAIKTVNMAILKGEKIHVHDPFNYLKESISNSELRSFSGSSENLKEDNQTPGTDMVPGIFIDDLRVDLPSQVLVLRPPSLVAGIGCNRNTATDEIKALLQDVLAAANLSLASLKCLASIDVKADEGGLITLGDDLDLPLVFFKRQELNQVKNIENPSKVVEKHVGVKSVCEAAAILASGDGTLIVPKQSTPNVTVAIARINFLWSE
jgi:cobalt-precorrin 5A hydrolase